MLAVAPDERDTAEEHNRRGEINEAVEEIFEAVAEMPAEDVEPVRRWTSVDDELPQEPYACLVIVECDKPCTGAEYQTILPYTVGYDGTWNDIGGVEIYYEVVAWWRVPEMPTEDGGETE